MDLDKLIEKIQPRKDWVLLELERYDGTEQHKNGLVTVTTKRFKEKAKVLKVGPGRTYKNGTFVPNTLKPGDYVFIANPAKCEFIPNKEGRYIALCPEPLIDGVYVEEDE